MAKPLPKIDQPSVAPQPIEPGYIRANPQPADFGATVGTAVHALGNDASEILVRERLKADAFAAADLETRFSKEATALLYDKQSGFLLQEGSAALDTKPIHESIEKLRGKYEGQAKNETQRRAFRARADERVVSFGNEVERHSGVQRKAYYKGVAEGQAAEAQTQIALNYDKPDEIEARLKAVRPLLLLHWADDEHLPPEKIIELWKSYEADSLGKAINEFVGREQGEAGLKYFNTVRERLGVTAAGWEHKLNVAIEQAKERRRTGEAAALGETLYQRRKDDPRFDVEKQLSAWFKSGTHSPDVLAGARRQYTAILAERNQQREISDGASYRAVYDMIAKQFEHDVDKALREGGEKFARAWNGLGGELQDRIRGSLYRADKFDPTEFAGYGKVLDLMKSGPGWSDRFPTFEVFMKDWQSVVGPRHWAEAVKLFESDQKRDRAQDANYSHIMSEAEMRFRAAVNFKRGISTPDNEFWENAPREVQDLRVWYTAQVQHMITQHRDATRKKDPDTYDATWYVEALDKLNKVVSDKAVRANAKQGRMPGTPDFNLTRHDRAERAWMQAHPGEPIDQAGVDAIMRGMGW